MAKLIELSAVERAFEAAVVVRENEARGEFLHHAKASRQLLRAAIEKAGRQVATETVARKKIAGEKQGESRAVKPAVPGGVA